MLRHLKKFPGHVQYWPYELETDVNVLFLNADCLIPSRQNAPVMYIEGTLRASFSFFILDNFSFFRKISFAPTFNIYSVGRSRSRPRQFVLARWTLLLRQVLVDGGPFWS